MKKTLTVNLGGTVYHIDEDAYLLLDRYLANLRICFKKEPDVEEIMKDFELRVAEHISDKLEQGYQVVTVNDVEEIIAQMGKPEDLRMAADEPAEDAASSRKERVKKKLFRNPDDKILGGVASGLAAYFGMDVTAVRLALVLLLFLPWCNFPVFLTYIFLWILMPMARTAADKLSMRGEQVTVENIGRNMTEGPDRMWDGRPEGHEAETSRSGWQRLGDSVVTVIGVLLKIGVVLMAVILSPAFLFLLFLLFIFFIWLVAVLLGGGAYAYSLVSDAWPMFSQASPVLALSVVVCLTLLIGIPMFSIVYAVLSHIFTSWKPVPVAAKWILLAVWIVAFVVAVVLFMQYPTLIPSYYY